jgi:hypothetical protein
MQFNNPILAGNVLVRNAMQSENYVAGSAGWRIERDGDVEFNDGTFRGDVHIFWGTDEVFLGVLFDKPLLEFYEAATLGRGSIWEESNAFNIMQRYSSSLDKDSPSLSFQKDTSPVIKRIVVNGPMVASDPTLDYDDPETWHAVSFSAGWGNFGAPYDNGAYKLGPDGFVHLHGVIKYNGGGVGQADGTVIFTIAASWRPAASKVLTIARGSGAQIEPVIVVAANGNCSIFGMNGAGGAGVGLDGLLFDIV